MVSHCTKIIIFGVRFDPIWPDVLVNVSGLMRVNACLFDLEWGFLRKELENPR